MAPHDLPFGYEPEVSRGDVSFLELEAIGNFYHTHFGLEFDWPPEHAEPDPQGEEEEEDWESDYPPSAPYVPTPDVLARVDQLIREMTDRANLLAFGTTDPQDEDYDEFFRHLGGGRQYRPVFRFEDDNDDDECSH